jgi:hypothetical protein
VTVDDSDFGVVLIAPSQTHLHVKTCFEFRAFHNDVIKVASIVMRPLLEILLATPVLAAKGFMDSASHTFESQTSGVTLS